MKKKSAMQRRPRRSSRHRLDFQRLEPRQLLAGDVAAPHQVESVLPVETNLVINGDFETIPASEINFYDPADVAGWETIGTETQLNIFDYQQYGKVLDLDSTAGEFDRVYQQVATETNTDYLVTFDFVRNSAGPEDTTPQSYDFEVWWNNEKIEVYTASSTWHTGTIRVTSGIDAATVLLFCEVREAGQPDGGDGVGVLLDNIRVMEATPLAVANAGFESVDQNREFFLPYQVDGWGAMESDPSQRWLKIQSSNDRITAPEGTRYLNLDALPSTRGTAFRDLPTTPGAVYYVSFDLRVDGVQDVDSDELRVRWNEGWAATIRGSHEWQNYGLMLTADSDTTRLTFLEPTNGSGSGPLIDNLMIYSVNTNSVFIDADSTTAGTEGSAVYVPGAGPVAIAESLELSHPTDNRITSATVTLGGVVDGNEEGLSISQDQLPVDGTGAPKITLLDYRPETRQLTLSGEATLAEYELVLRSLTYFNSADEVGSTDRTVQINVSNLNLPLTHATSEAIVTVGVETDQRAIDDAILTKFAADNQLDAQPVSDGLYVVIDSPGTGLHPTINSNVTVAYTGFLLELNDQNQMVEGSVFDASPSTGTSFPLSGVITGWQLGIPEFKTGGFGKLLIPSHLAYGPGGSGAIPGDSVLVFDVRLISHT